MLMPHLLAVLPFWAWVLVAGVLGLLVGSFLNVVILRMPERMAHAWRHEAREILELEPVEDAAPPDLVRQPSHCPHCKHRLSALDNIPLLGWLMLGGRCRYCKARISIQYPLVELLTALLSAAVVLRFGPGWVGVAGLVFTWILMAASGIDFRTQLLPDQLVYPLLWLGLMLSLLPMFVQPHTAILGAFIGYMSLWSLYWLFKLATGKEGMGYGDFKLLAALGAWMGPVALLPIMLLSSLIGAIVGVTLIATRRHERGVPMPFGPFIAAAGWVWLVAGPFIQHAYMHYFGLG